MFAGLAVLSMLGATLPMVEAAGNSRETATLIAEGTVTGTAFQSQYHWFRVEVPAGKAAQISFQVLSGSTNDDIAFVDEEDRRVVTIAHTRTGAFDPDGPSAWIKVMSFWSDLTYSFTLALIDVQAQDDADSGRDAANSRNGASSIQAGRIAGRLVPTSGDPADWYRVDAPTGMIVDVHSAVGTYVDVYDVEDNWLGSVDDWGAPSDRTLAILSDGRPIYLRLTSTLALHYGFSVDVTPAADLRVEHVEIRQSELLTSAGSTGLSLQREILVTLANVGLGPSRSANLTVIAIHEGPTASRLIAERNFSIASGETSSLSVPWDTLGQIGDFTIVVAATNEYESEPLDNRWEEKTSVHVGGLARGVDGLNHDVRVSSTGAGTEYGGPRVGARTSFGFVGFERGTLSILGR